VTFLFARKETRLLDSTNLIAAPFDNAASIIGDTVGDSLSLIPLYAATGMIADSISIMPVTAYRNTRGGVKRKLDVQPELTYAPHPNPRFTRVEWLHQVVTSLLLRGNAFGLILDWDSNGIPRKIQVLHPDAVRVDETSPIKPVYFYNGKEQRLDNIIHIPWFPPPGSIVGASPVSLFRTQLETGQYASRYGSQWFKHGAHPSGHLKWNAGTLDPTKAAEIKRRFKASVSGGDVFVSGMDWDWQQLQVSPQDAQFLQTIKATATQVAAIFRVDPEDIGGETGSSRTYATLEANQLKYTTRALQPIFTRLEAHLSALMPEFEYVKFNADVLIRTDTLSRATAHKINLQSGVETLDEAREKEDKAPLTDAQRQQWKEDYPASGGGGADALPTNQEPKGAQQDA
jgi:HK97 family phage portal protein